MSSNSKPLDVTNKTCRRILTPHGVGEIDFFVLGRTGRIEYVMVWLGEEKKWMRPHVRYPVDECYELEE